MGVLAFFVDTGALIASMNVAVHAPKPPGDFDRQVGALGEARPVDNGRVDLGQDRLGPSPL
ncbi:MAG: hypothetical protein U5L08_13710 [Xanthomonadales bacterium]|nr:hypothetical protein [Xanthomonadales bacterium]